MRNDFNVRSVRKNVALKNIAIGLMLGYPICCVKSYAGHRDHRNVTKILWGSGYSPCKKCARHSKAYIISGINKNRFISKKFGDDSINFKEFTKKYVYTQLGLAGQHKVKTVLKNIRVRSRLLTLK